MKPVSLLTGILMTFVGGTLDAYTFITHGVFATAQTGNVVLLIVGIVQGRDPWHFVFPIIAFTLAVMAVQPVKHVSSPARARAAAAAVIVFEILILVAVGFVSPSAPSEWVAVPLSALAGLQLGLFRSVAGIGFASIATTGNLMRLAEAGYAVLGDRNRDNLRTLLVCAAIVAGFCAGALAGAALTFGLHAAAIWGSAAVQLVVLVLYLIETARTGSKPV